MVDLSYILLVYQRVMINGFRWFSYRKCDLCRVRYPHLCPEKLVNAGRVGNQQRPTYEKDMERLENIRRNDYPLVNKQFAIEHGPVEIVDLPINSMVDLPMVSCVFTMSGSYQGTSRRYPSLFVGLAQGSFPAQYLPNLALTLSGKW